MAVRKEVVRLILEDDFTAGMARAAASAALLDKNLSNLDKNAATVRAALRGMGKDVDGIGAGLGRSSKQIDTFSGRLSLVAKAATVLGPALVPLGTAAVGGMAALGVQMGVVATAGGVMVAALSGVGDALEALNAAQLEPTAENLAEVEAQLTRLGPAGASFVQFLDSIAPQLLKLQLTAREGLLPGLEDGIESLLTLAPQVQSIVGGLATTLGDLFREAGAGLAGDGFARFFDYLDTTAAPLLREFGQSIGNVAEGMANLVVGLSPITDDFSRGLLNMTESFAEWSRSLDSNQGFQDFVQYVRESGPQVLDLLGSLSAALLAFADAVAPIGNVVLPLLTAMADAFSAIAANDIGGTLLTAAAGMAALNSAAGLAGGAFVGLGGSAATTSAALGAFRAGAPQLIALLGGIAAIDAALGQFEFADDMIDGNLRDPLLRLADGEVTGKLDALSGQLGVLRSNVVGGGEWLDELTTGFGALGGTLLDDATESIGNLDTALADLVREGGTTEAAAAFEQISAKAREAGYSAEEAAALFPEYARALEQSAESGALAAQASADLAAAAQEEAQAIRESVAAMYEKRDAALAAFDAETGYRQALKAATAAARENNAGIKGSTEAALTNRGALSQLAGAWNNQSDAVKNNEARFKEARTAFIQTARAMDVPKEAAIELANRLLDIPEQRVVKTKLDGVGPAISSAEALAAALDSIPRSVRVQITESVSRIKETVSGLGFAAGGHVPTYGPQTITLDKEPLA